MSLPSSYPWTMSPKFPRLVPLLVGAALLIGMSSCASVEFERDTKTSGTYRSSATSFTLFTIDMPADALGVARENASDAGQAAMIELEASVFPDWGWWNWVLDIISIRTAKVSGAWGFEAP